jgi:hypothetical protein
MTTTSVLHTLRHALLPGILALSALAVMGCGGGGGSLLSGGVGSGGSGVAEGTVSGFGSVVVDGVAYDDANASSERNNEQGTTDPVQVKLGQRVRIFQSQTGVADRIMVLPQLRGTASTAADANGWFQLLGQWVRVVSTLDKQNTPTVLEGLNTVSAGDNLEVHGSWVYDASKQASVLVASRVEMLSAAPDPVLISGVVRTVNASVVTLDGANAKPLQLANIPSTIAAQSLITAWVPRSDLAHASWSAIRLIDASTQPSDANRLTLGAQINPTDSNPGTVTVQGMTVQLPSNWSAPPSPMPVQLVIERDGNDWKAVSVTQRQNDSDLGLGGAITLKGTLSWPTNPTTLRIRDVRVNIPQALLAAPNCNALQPGDSVYLNITARRTPGGGTPVATQMLCDLQSPASSVIERSGRLVGVTPIGNGSSGTLQVSTERGLVINLQWSSLTLRPANLNPWIGQNVSVEYQVINGDNRLRNIQLDQ